MGRACTALFAATIGIAQNDIKKVLAYSTVSQLGYMFIGVGVGAYRAGIFHLMTHAFFKACLFLGSGCVIHAMGGEQDMRKMGGLRQRCRSRSGPSWSRRSPSAGIPPFAGFFSKDEISASISPRRSVCRLGLGPRRRRHDGFYMFRQVYMTFFGEIRGTHTGTSSARIAAVDVVSAGRARRAGGGWRVS